MLWVEQRRIARRQTKEPGVKLVDVVEQHRCLDEIGIRQHIIRHTDRTQMLVREFSARITPIAQHAPKGVEVGGAGQAAPHANHGDIGFCHEGV